MSKRLHLYMITFFTDVRSVGTGHRMVAECWKMFEEVVSEAGVRELPQGVERHDNTTTSDNSDTDNTIINGSRVITITLPIKKEGSEPKGKDPVLIRVESKAHYQCLSCELIK